MGWSQPTLEPVVNPTWAIVLKTSSNFKCDRPIAKPNLNRSKLKHIPFKLDPLASPPILTPCPGFIPDLVPLLYV